LGEGASGLSATNIVRLKSGWETDYKAWSQRDLSAKRYVYWWADGVYFNVRLDEERTCVLVLIGATEDGTKELLAVVDGLRKDFPRFTPEALEANFNLVEFLKDLAARKKITPAQSRWLGWLGLVFAPDFLQRIPPRAAVETSTERIGLWQGVPGFLH
jgi:Transposase, Mutator family